MDRVEFFQAQAVAPPFKRGLSQVLTTAMARTSPMTRPPITRMLASLCSRLIRAANRSPHRAARTCGNRLATMDIPRPVPHMRIPRENSPLETAAATRLPKSG